MLFAVVYLASAVASLGLCFTTGEHIPFDLQLGTADLGGVVELTKLDPASTTGAAPTTTFTAQSTPTPGVSGAPQLPTPPTSQTIPTAERTRVSGTSTTSERTTIGGIKNPNHSGTTTTSPTPEPNDTSNTTPVPSPTDDGIDVICPDDTTVSPSSVTKTAITVLECTDDKQEPTTTPGAVTTITSTRTFTTTGQASGNPSGAILGRTVDPTGHIYRRPPPPVPTADYALSSASIQSAFWPSSIMVFFTALYFMCA